jgi:hypothetical protein
MLQGCTVIQLHEASATVCQAVLRWFMGHPQAVDARCYRRRQRVIIVYLCSWHGMLDRFCLFGVWVFRVALCWLQNATKAAIPFYGSYQETDPAIIAAQGVDR